MRSSMQMGNNATKLKTKSNPKSKGVKNRSSSSKSQNSSSSSSNSNILLVGSGARTGSRTRTTSWTRNKRDCSSMSIDSSSSSSCSSSPRPNEDQGLGRNEEYSNSHSISHSSSSNHSKSLLVGTENFPFGVTINKISGDRFDTKGTKAARTKSPSSPIIQRPSPRDGKIASTGICRSNSSVANNDCNRNHTVGSGLCSSDNGGTGSVNLWQPFKSSFCPLAEATAAAAAVFPDAGMSLLAAPKRSDRTSTNESDSASRDLNKEKITNANASRRSTNFLPTGIFDSVNFHSFFHNQIGGSETSKDTGSIISPSDRAQGKERSIGNERENRVASKCVEHINVKSARKKNLDTPSIMTSTGTTTKPTCDHIDADKENRKPVPGGAQKIIQLKSRSGSSAIASVSADTASVSIPSAAPKMTRRGRRTRRGFGIHKKRILSTSSGNCANNHINGDGNGSCNGPRGSRVTSGSKVQPPSQAPLSPFNDVDMDQMGTGTISSPPIVRIIAGKKVTMVDEHLKIFIIDLLSPETCEMIRTMTDNHVRKIHSEGNKVATWRTLYTYTKQDLPCGEVPHLTTITERIMRDVITCVGEIYENPREALKLRQRSWKEPHLLLYQNIENVEPHVGVPMHYDGCHVTWNACITRSDEYQGGGTYIRAIRKTVRLEQGQVLVHPGELYHKGCDITGGIRLLIVCFMDGYDPKIADPSSEKTDSVEYEKNVRSY